MAVSTIKNNIDVYNGTNCTIYKTGHVCTMKINNSSETFETISDSKFIPSYTVKIPARIYKVNADYINCDVYIDTSGVCTIKDEYNGSLSDVEYAFLSPRTFVYEV